MRCIYFSIKTFLKSSFLILNMNKWIEILIGLILVIGIIIVGWYSGVWWGEFWNFKHAAWEFLKGGVAWMVLGIGLLLLLLGISDLRS